ncbi:WD40 repeat protein [Methanomicrobium sp. W14]|uniref:TolB family protein n=1 Tax=Methanomicrobium sp. W14 TaxID=2817839 RepID=UPI001AE131C6|nr:hypothetical protein [Methanomicrobium sp. W14]MBP2134133.1 WD40 repeat protein [Methanomicrobium sp. W14]
MKKRAITAILIIIIISVIAYPLFSDLTSGEIFPTSRISPVINAHCLILDISGDRMLYQFENVSGMYKTYLSDLNGTVYDEVKNEVPFFPELDNAGDKFAATENLSEDLRIYNSRTRTDTRINVQDIHARYIYDISWSPKGDKIAITVATASSDYSICVYDLNTGESENIFNSTEYFSPPSWSPDENYLSFIVQNDSRSTESTMYIADLKNLSVTASGLKIENNAHTNIPERTAWSPKGDIIAYSSSGTIGICSPDGKYPDLIKCYKDNSICKHLEWSPDGSKILYCFILPPGSPENERIGFADPKTSESEEILSATLQYGHTLSWADNGTKVACLENSGYDNGFLIDTGSRSGNNIPVIIFYIIILVIPACIVVGWYFGKGKEEK